MVAHRKTVSQLKLVGSLRKNPKRYAGRNEPAALPPLGPPPVRGPLSFSEAWAYVVATAPERTLHRRDRLLLEETATLLQAIRANDNEVLFPLLRRFERCLTLLGLTPSDGARICATPPPTKNVFDDV